MKSIFDLFKRKSGSNVWPSDDPQDSPFDTFTCHICGESISLQIYGERPIDSKSFDERAADALRDHMLSHLTDARLWR